MMTKEAKLAIYRETERRVIAKLNRPYTPAIMFDIRYMAGEAFIMRYYPEKDHNGLIRSKAYWNWFRMVWQMNDRKWLAERRGSNYGIKGYYFWHKWQMERTYIGRAEAKAIGVNPQTQPRNALPAVHP